MCVLACVCMCLWQLQICGLLVCSNSKTEIRANGKFGIRKWNCFHTNSLLAKWKSFTQHTSEVLVLCCTRSSQHTMCVTHTQNRRKHIVVQSMWARCTSVYSQPITFNMVKIKRINIDKSYFSSLSYVRFICSFDFDSFFSHACSICRCLRFLVIFLTINSVSGTLVIAKPFHSFFDFIRKMKIKNWCGERGLKIRPYVMDFDGFASNKKVASKFDSFTFGVTIRYSTMKSPQIQIYFKVYAASFHVDV